jgi:HYR domain/GEVED domain/Secretion system C-terminal sorting domain
MILRGRPCFTAAFAILVLLFCGTQTLSAQCDLVSPDAPANGIDTDCDGLDALHLQLPAYCYLTEGKSFEFFFRNVFLSKHPQDYTCTVITGLTGGVANAESWRLTPNSGQIGEHALTLQVKNNAGQLLASASTTLRIAAAITPASVGAKRIIVMGHSLVDQGVMPYYLRQLTDETGNPAFTHHGTRVSWTDNNTHHEGKGGASWKFFAHDNASALRFNNQLNLRNYFNSVICQGCNPDYFVIQLDGNDFCFNGQVNGGTMQEVDDYIDAVYQADILPIINAIRTVSPNTKIGICLAAPANGRSSVFLNHFGASSILADPFRWEKILSRIYVKYTQYFAGREDENISIIPIHLGVDDMAHFDNIDPVHPYASVTSNGYFPISKSIYGWAKYQMATSVAFCGINARTTQVTCNANATFTNPGDDTYSYALDVSGLNNGQNWTATIQGQAITGTVGTPKQLGPYAISAGAQTYEVAAQASPSCKTRVTVSAAPCSNGVPVKSDLQLTIATPNTLPGLFVGFRTTYTVYNNSANAAEGVWVHVPKPAQIQILNPSQIATSQGSFDWSVTNLWTVGTIPAFGTVTLAFDYYNVQGGIFPIYAQVYAQVQPDVDSAPINGNGVSAIEDDEFALIIGQTGTNPCTNDVVPPVLQGCPTSQSLTTAGTTAVATWTNPLVSDLCPGATTLVSNFNSGNSFTLGATTVTYTARDAANNSATCSFQIQVSQLITNTCTGNLLQNPGFENGLTSWYGTGGQISTDAASGTKSLQICTASSNMLQTLTAVAGNTYTLTWQGKTAGANQNIAVAIKFLSGSWNLLASDLYVFDSPGAYQAGTRQLAAPAQTAYVEVSFYKLNSGCVYLDDICLTAGGGTNPCAPDTAPPTLSACPANISVSTSGTTATAMWTAPTASDACAGTVNVSATHVSGATFLIGSTSVVYTARDASNNTSTCSFSVQVSALGNPNCTAVSAFPWESWIGQVRVGTISNPSSKSPYTNFASPTFTVSRTAPTAIALTAGFSYFNYLAYWRIWIDYNHDNIFQANEKVYEGTAPKLADGTPSSVLNGNIPALSGALTGPAKMRVIMSLNAFTDACGNVAIGEVEDYTVQVMDVLASNINKVEQAVLPTAPLTIYPNPAGDLVSVFAPDWAAKSVHWRLYNQLGVQVAADHFDGDAGPTYIDLSNVLNGVYFIRVEIDGQRAMTERLMVQRVY